MLRLFQLHPHELVVDSFAGGGGASAGIEAAIGRPVDIAINHDPEAIAVHRANHPGTRHYCASIWEVSPGEACAGRPVGLAWFSPDCTHFSRAKGNKPREKGIRGLAWVVVRWAKEVAPRVIILENVEEFQTWGPLLEDGRPDPARAGETFREWLAQLTGLGYTVEFQSLVAADFGAPTTRRRLFLVARRDGLNPAWPKPTHGKGRIDAWRPAAEVIDWSLPCPSIFDRPRPLAEATLRRIAAGFRKYVIEADNPFVIPVRPNGRRLGNGEGLPLTGRAFLIKYYGANGHPQTADVRDPLHTVTATARFGLGTVLIGNEPFQIIDIGMRMLQPHELFAAQGFPEDYEIAPWHRGKPLTKTAQIRLAGNSVCPPVAQAIVAANAVAA